MSEDFSSPPPPPMRGRLASRPHFDEVSSWVEDRRAVLEALDRHERTIEAQGKKIQKLETEIAVIKAKTALVSAGITFGVATAFEVLIRYLPH